MRLKAFSDRSIDIMMSHSDRSILEAILRKDTLAKLSTIEKKLLWRYRRLCLNMYPNELPKLLKSVKWCKHAYVCEAYKLVSAWPDVRPIVALELLNGAYADLHVRRFAVRCLDKWMRNEQVQQYLLQLVQALKSEPYYDGELGRFLLRRAFQSTRLGFDLFWLLRFISLFKSTIIPKSQINAKIGIVFIEPILCDLKFCVRK